ncbi:TPR domain protein [Formosa sp. Hel1_33_131]|nr:TPR domain protein [Formosa sp. Hel1_33_131]
MESGKTSVIAAYKDNYWEILPVERLQITDDIDFRNKAKNLSIELAEVKAVKAIQKHGMNIKGKEKNPQIDEAFMLLGKARYFDNRFIPALEAFNYILFKYPASNNINLAKIWRAKTNLRLQNEDIAIKNLKRLIELEDLSKYDIVEASSTLAQAYITTKALDSAITQLQVASQLTKNNEQRGRLHFIEGQLYSALGKKDSANLAFDKVIDLNRRSPRAYMISAHLEKVKNFDLKNGDKLELQELLEDLETNRENRPFLDKIYHQIAKYQLQNESDSTAISYFNKSLRTNSEDDYLKAVNYQTLGDLNFDYSEYSLAGSYYDSTLLSLKENSKSFRAIKRKRENLEDVIYYESIAQDNDSILSVVAMSDADKEVYFQSYIETLKLEEEVSEKVAASTGNSFGASQNAVTKKGKSFYFYNPTTVAFGKNEFIRIWGDRALETNWRWSSKSAQSDTETTDEIEKAAEAAEEEEQKRYSVDYYLAQIPTEEKVLDSIAKERNFAYYQLGLIYKDKFKEYKRAQNKLEYLLKQNPEERLVLPAKYNLYKLYALLDLKRLQALAKSDIIENFPDSRYAEILLNPESALLNNENSPETLYNNLYAQFELGEYQQVIDGCDLQIIRLDGDQIVPKLELLKVTSKARLFGFEAYKEGLNFVALNYPSSIEGKKAAQMYETVIPQLESVEFVQDSTQTNFKTIFKFEASETDEIKAFDESLSTAIEDIDYFKLSISKDRYDTNTIFVVVHGLKSVQGAFGFAEILKNKNDFIISKPFFGISSKNYQTVQIHKNLEAYLETIN